MNINLTRVISEINPVMNISKVKSVTIRFLRMLNLDYAI